MIAQQSNMAVTENKTTRSVHRNIQRPALLAREDEWADRSRNDAQVIGQSQDSDLERVPAAPEFYDPGFIRLASSSNRDLRTRAGHYVAKSDGGMPNSRTHDNLKQEFDDLSKDFDEVFDNLRKSRQRLHESQADKRNLWSGWSSEEEDPEWRDNMNERHDRLSHDLREKVFEWKQWDARAKSLVGRLDRLRQRLSGDKSHGNSTQDTNDSRPPLPPSSIHVNPRDGQNVTVHLELGAVIGVEEPLELFSELWRLGHFQRARSFFQQNLERFLDNGYVLSQYAQFLLDALDIPALLELAEEFPPDPTRGVVQTNWYLALVKAQRISGVNVPLLSRISRPDVAALLRSSWPALDSTEVQVLILGMENCGEFLGGFADLYEHLKKQKRIWDLRDLLHLFVTMDMGVSGCLLRMLEGSLNVQAPTVYDIIQSLQDDWNTLAGDETITLALLDIFTTLANDAAQNLGDVGWATAFFEAAQRYAVDLANRSPSHLKTRPYLCWVASEALLQQYREPHTIGLPGLRKHLEKLAGTYAISPSVFPSQSMPFFIPANDVPPNWQPNTLDNDEQEEVLCIILKYALELGDVELQAACLQELIYRCPDPQKLLEDLKSLWMAVGNRRRYLHTCLYCYLSTSSPDSRETLRRELLTFGETCSDRLLERAQYSTLGMLTSSSHERDTYLERSSRAYFDSHFESRRYQESRDQTRRRPPVPQYVPRSSPRRTDSRDYTRRYQPSISEFNEASPRRSKRKPPSRYRNMYEQESETESVIESETEPSLDESVMSISTIRSDEGSPIMKDQAMGEITPAISPLRNQTGVRLYAPRPDQVQSSGLQVEGLGSPDSRPNTSSKGPMAAYVEDAGPDDEE